MLLSQQERENLMKSALLRIEVTLLSALRHAIELDAAERDLKSDISEYTELVEERAGPAFELKKLFSASKFGGELELAKVELVLGYVHTAMSELQGKDGVV